MNANHSKNDKAWQKLFQEENILENIERKGCFYISSETINKKREARLMTKFDHKSQLPKLFRDNNLSIQPVARGTYIIGHFSSYFSFDENKFDQKIEYKELPSHFQTVISNNISSESSAIICAYLSGMIDDILEEKTDLTVFGRMSTGVFNYQIDNLKNGQFQKIKVENCQCEIDGGFEGQSKFAILEAKCQSVDDFIIRQLYYPYKLWESKTNKKIVPIFLFFSNNIFTFYVFKFLDSNCYNSIQLESIHRYCIDQCEIELSDIRGILKEIKSFDANQNTFPQADNFIKIIDLLDKLNIHGFLSKDEITTEYTFDLRQTDYYIAAGVYLGIFERLQVQERSGCALSDKGKKIMKLDPKRKNLELVKTILSHKVFKLVLDEYLNNAQKPEREKIIAIMKNNLSGLNQTTLSRRAQTVRKWIEWILQLTSM